MLLIHRVKDQDLDVDSIEGQKVSMKRKYEQTPSDVNGNRNSTHDAITYGVETVPPHKPSGSCCFFYNKWILIMFIIYRILILVYLKKIPFHKKKHRSSFGCSRQFSFR